MKSSLLATLAFLIAGFRYDFPRDHFNHPAYRTEWWYYTGNLKTPDGRPFGFELTFFRQAQQTADSGSPVWRADQIYLAHLALSDIKAQKFYHTERLNRAGPGLAGADFGTQRLWNGNWQVLWKGETQQLTAVSDHFTLHLVLHSEKPFVINRKTSPYISFTRLAATGDLERAGTKTSLSGLAWMDHEFFNEPAAANLAGWDWFAIQLDSGEELMLYRLRTKSGQMDAHSSGTYVDSRGAPHFLAASQFALSPSELWQSPESGARYPLAWDISVPSLGLELSEQTALKDQELFTPHSAAPTYWEGAVTYRGRLHAQAARGVGYLEMTGYK
jgi:predicted secreted hydrolase